MNGGAGAGGTANAGGTAQTSGSGSAGMKHYTNSTMISLKSTIFP